MRFKLSAHQISLAAAVHSSIALAAGNLELPQALSEAAKGSPQIQKAEEALTEAGWAKVEAASAFMPKLQVSAQHIFEYKLQYNDVNFGAGPVSFPLIFPTSQLMLQGTFPIFDGLAAANQYRAGSSRHEAAKLELEWARFSLDREVSLRFFEAIASAKLGEVAKQNARTLEDHLAQTSAKLKAGTATQFDRLRVEVQLNEANSEVLKADDDLAIARLRLANTMGLEHDERALSGELPVPSKDGIAALNPDPLSMRPDLAAQSSRVAGLDRASSALAAHWVPRLYLGGNYLKYNNLTDNLSDWDRYRDAYQVGFYVSWNLFDGLASTAKERETTHQFAQAEKSLEQARMNASTDFAFWKRRYLYSLALFEAKSSDAQKAEESVRLARIGYKAGTLTSSEVLDAELDLFRSRAGMIRAQLSCAEAHLKLELATGRKI